MVVLANCWLLALEDESEHRRLLCAVLINAQSVTTVVLAVNAFFCFVFRCLVVIHAEKGLIVKGKPDLRLLNQLYWLIVLSFTTVNIFIIFYFYQTIIITENFVSSSPMAICLMVNGKEDSEKKDGLSGIRPAFLFIQYACMSYLNMSLNRFLKGHCPGRKMSCIGKRRRNVVSLKETFWLIHMIMLSGFLDDTLESVFMYLKIFLSQKSIFLLWSFINFISKEGLYLILPMLVEKPSIEKRNAKNIPFYTRAPKVLEPRAPCNGQFLRLMSPNHQVAETKISQNFVYLSHKHFEGGPRFRANHIPPITCVEVQ